MISGGGKSYIQFTPQIAKYDLPLKLPSMIYPPSEIAREDLPLKLPRTIYPPTPKITREDLPLKSPRIIYPPPQIINFEQNFRHTTSCFASQRSFLRKTNEYCKTFYLLQEYGQSHENLSFLKRRRLIISESNRITFSNNKLCQRNDFNSPSNKNLRSSRENYYCSSKVQFKPHLKRGVMYQILFSINF